MKKLVLLFALATIGINTIAQEQKKDTIAAPQIAPTTFTIILDNNGLQMLLDIVKNTSAPYNEVQYFLDIINKQQNGTKSYSDTLSANKKTAKSKK